MKLRTRRIQSFSLVVTVGLAVLVLLFWIYLGWAFARAMR